MDERQMSVNSQIPDLTPSLPPPRAGIQSVEVGFGLLQALAASRGPLMLRDLALSAGMSAAKAHRYLVSFQRLALVTHDVGTTRYDRPGSFKVRACFAFKA